MALPPPPLPAEVWTHVFGYLSVPDKLSLRACCKYFRKLVDHWSLWRGWTAVLTFRSGVYNRKFWESLRRRKVASVVMRRARAKDWRQLSLELPDVSALAVEQSAMEDLRFGAHFARLERLAVRNSDVVIDASRRPRLEQLTQLSLCEVTFPIKSSFLPFISHLRNLTSLTCHNSGHAAEPVRMMESLLSSLPKLQHLSLSSKRACVCVPRRPVDARVSSSLSTLELIQRCDHFFPVSAMKTVPHLRALSVVSAEEYLRAPSASSHLAFLLNHWLQDLPGLSALAVTGGPPVGAYAASIPATVRSLTLRGSALSHDDASAVSAQLPDLLHLHLDPWPSRPETDVARLPELFPKLRSLTLRRQSAPEKDFLRLQRLRDLERLEILDGAQQHPSRLAAQLRALTTNRLRVAPSPRPSDPMLCPCVPQAY